MEEKIAALCEKLSSTDLTGKEQAAFELGKLGADGKAALGALLDVYFNDSMDFNTWSAIAKAVQRIVFAAAEKRSLSPAQKALKRVELESGSTDPHRCERAALLARYLPR